jgi:hypothetical protein
LQSNILASVYLLGTCFYFNDANLNNLPKNKIINLFYSSKN